MISISWHMQYVPPPHRFRPFPCPAPPCRFLAMPLPAPPREKKLPPSSLMTTSQLRLVATLAPLCFNLVEKSECSMFISDHIAILLKISITWDITIFSFQPILWRGEFHRTACWRQRRERRTTWSKPEQKSLWRTTGKRSPKDTMTKNPEQKSIWS